MWLFFFFLSFTRVDCLLHCLVKFFIQVFSQCAQLNSVKKFESHIFQGFFFFFFFHEGEEIYRTWLIKNNCYVSIPDLAAFQWWVKLFSYVFQIYISVPLKH